jgi:hypothetical protein
MNRLGVCSDCQKSGILLYEDLGALWLTQHEDYGNGLCVGSDCVPETTYPHTCEVPYCFDCDVIASKQ